MKQVKRILFSLLWVHHPFQGNKLFWYENGRRVIKYSPQIDEVSDFTENHSLDVFVLFFLH
jgi:hypothetical protein